MTHTDYGSADLFQCRTRLCGWCNNKIIREGKNINNVSMPHAALWVVQLQREVKLENVLLVSMPHAALWVVQLYDEAGRLVDRLSFQCRTRLCGWCNIQQGMTVNLRAKFQCRTRLCGWCSQRKVLQGVSCEYVSMPHAALWVVQRRSGSSLVLLLRRFNAARGFVGGATASLAALVPLWGKSPFGKSPEI